MTIVAKAHEVGDKVVPLPFDFTPSQIKPNDKKDIIVAIADANDGIVISKKAYNFYGKENCRRITANLPSYETPRLILCVSTRCILNKINDAESTLPDSDISPMWTENRFGMTANEALLIQEVDLKTKTLIKQKALEFGNKLSRLKIKMDSGVLTLIQECRQLIEEAQNHEARASRECRENTAEIIAKFMQKSFPVKTWVENLVEPVVAFSVDRKITDDKALIIGIAIDQVMNGVDIEEAQDFFDTFVYDACFWPVIVDRTFDDDGNRRN